MNKTKNSLRDQCDRLIDYLADKNTGTCKYCEEEKFSDGDEPVMIGDVMNYISNNIMGGEAETLHWDLRRLWGSSSRESMSDPFDLTKSLNEIFSGEIEIICSHLGRPTNGIHTCIKGATHEEQFKDKDTQSLFVFLRGIFKDRIK